MCPVVRSLVCLVCLQIYELLPGGCACIPQLSEALMTVSRALDAEMGSMPAVEVG